MNTLVQRTFFEKVNCIGCKEGELGKVLHGVYEQHGKELRTPDPRTMQEFRKQMKAKRRIGKEIHTGCFMHSKNSHFGTSSYHTTELIEEK